MNNMMSAPAKLKTIQESKLNMAFLDTMAFDEGRKAFHDYLQKCYFSSDRSLYLLDNALFALSQVYTILRWAFSSNDREKIDKKIKAANMAIFNIRNEFDYRTFKNNLLFIMDEIYRAKQEAGIGMPMQSKEDFLTRLNERI